MLTNINLNLLRSLHILLQECHVTRAAERLHITQSAMSRQLAQLRELCQDPLLIREGNQLVPSSKATQLQTKLDALLAEFDALLTDAPFDPSTYHGELVFASSDYVAHYVLPHIAVHLTALAPNLDIAFQLWQPKLLNELHQSNIQLASSMFPEQPTAVSSMHIGSDKSVCIMRCGHPLADSCQLDIEDFLSYSHIKITGGGDKDSFIEDYLQHLGQQRRIAFKVPFFATAMDRLVNSDYLLVVPEHIASNLSKHWPVIYLPLPFAAPIQHYWLFWHPKYDNQPAHRWLRMQIADTLKSADYSI